MIDARGMACPQPVLLIKAELDKTTEGVVSITVDNKGSCINVKNFCEANGCTVSVKELADGCFQIDAAKGYDCAIAEKQTENSTNIVVFVTGECVGNEEPELGRMLMKGFIGNLKHVNPLPKTVIFVNNSVRMVTLNLEVAETVKELEALGVEVLACGACLNYFNLVDELKAGKVSDALTVANKLFGADKVIRL
ncbi:MAG: sulfurtransferase-like selenium metabolism protein YedF [Deferribacterales bacterium]